VLPLPNRSSRPSLEPVLQDLADLTDLDKEETRISATQVRCIEHWNTLVKQIPSQVPLPSFPIWSDEFGATYPFEHHTPYVASKACLLSSTAGLGGKSWMTSGQLIDLLPSYAREAAGRFPGWKIQFIRQNRAWYQQIQQYMPEGWLSTLRGFVPSHRKLEWNCQGEVRDLWEHVLQFRPSGLRVKRRTSIPALVSLTTTQVPIIGPRRRFVTRQEALRLQGFPIDHELPASREAAFEALGNAVHVGMVTLLAGRLFSEEDALTPGADEGLAVGSVGATILRPRQVELESGESATGLG
jgi:DNA (cytosine-5)-methyltransferase 1